MRWLPLVSFAVLAACGTANPPQLADAGIPAFRGLLATPRQLAFTCVVPGCDTTLKVKVTSNVNRRVAIKRIVLSTPASEYTLSPAEQPPFILGAASDFDIDVRFAPLTAPKSESINLLVTYTDASGEESPDRIEPGELSIPLVKRLVGEPVLEATPTSLSFGVVAVSQRKELSIDVRNAGFGNIALAVDRADAGAADLDVRLPTDVSLVPDAGVAVPFIFTPQTEQHLLTEVELASSTPGTSPVFIKVEGTSHAWPHVALEPEETALEFGDIRKGQSRTVLVKLANHGGQPLNITSVSATDTSGRVAVSFPGGMTTATLQPLERLSLEVKITGSTPGIIDVPLQVVSNDPGRPMLSIPIRAVITEPRLQATPMSIDWGTMPMGWVVTKPIELKNVGYGALTVRRITFVGGSSTLFSLRNLPALPMTLERDARVAFEVEFRAETAASFIGAVSIETDDPVNPFSEVALAAVGGSCASGCPIANGTPSCTAGACAIGTCNTGWYDTDQSASNGCECKEIGTDPGSLCSAGLDKGTLADNGSSSNHTGLIHSATDVDYLRFFGEDRSQVFSEDYDVRITLSSGDPGITMCVSRYNTPVSVNECYPESNKVCGIRSFRRDGSYGTEDGAMYYIKVYRTASSTPSCTPYTLYMVNG